MQSYGKRDVYLSVVPPHVQTVVAQDLRALVDVVDGQLDGGHDAAADTALRHVPSEREEAGYVDVVTLVESGGTLRTGAGEQSQD